MNFRNLEKKLALEPHALAQFEPQVSRRQFIKMTSLSGLAIGVAACSQEQASQPEVNEQAIEPALETVGLNGTPSKFLQIAADGKITVVINRLEFGQGAHTGLARIIADELDADWSMVTAELGGTDDAYKDPFAGIQLTGGSSSIKNSYVQYRELGARARAMLLSAAAAKWSVEISELSVSDGVVKGPDGQTIAYGDLATDAMALEIPSEVTLKPIDQFKYVGTSVARLDTKAKSTGQQSFGIDVKLPDLRTAMVARPPTFGGTVVSFDAKQALKVAGVEDIFEVDLDRGATGVAVVATGFWPAKTARDLLQIEWQDGSKELPDTERIAASFNKLLDEPGITAQEADLSGLEQASKTIQADYHFPFLAHTPMEPLNATISVSGEGDTQQVTVYCGTQSQTFDQLKLAQVMGVAPAQITIHTEFAGGAFGRRATGHSDCVADTGRVMNAWLASGRKEPIKLVWSREDDVRGGYYRPLTVHRAEIGLGDKGDVLAWKHRIVSPSLLAGTPMEEWLSDTGIDGSATEGVAGSAYNLPIHLDVHHPHSDVPVLWWRSVGHTHTAYVMETLVDEIAAQTDKDPVRLRRELLKDKTRELETLELVLEKSNYSSRELPEGHALGLAIHGSFDSVVAHVVEVSIEDQKPVVHNVTSAVHCNMAVNPLSVAAQVEGSVLMGIGSMMPGADITIKDGRVQQSNFHDYIVPRLPDMPPIDIHIVPSNEPPTGIGEPGLPPIAPAIANAIFALTGKPVRSLPIQLG